MPAIGFEVFLVGNLFALLITAISFDRAFRPSVSLSVVGALRGPFFRVTFSSVKGVSVLRILRGIRPANPLVGECLELRLSGGLGP